MFKNHHAANQKVPEAHYHGSNQDSNLSSRTCNFNDSTLIVNKPKRALPFGGTTDWRNIYLSTRQIDPSEQLQFSKNTRPMSSHATQTDYDELDSLSYNSRPRRALPQIASKASQQYVLFIDQCSFL